LFKVHTTSLFRSVPGVHYLKSPILDPISGNNIHFGKNTSDPLQLRSLTISLLTIQLFTTWIKVL